MKPALKPDLADFILPLNMNGLQGRMLRAPASSNKTREILVVYGHHATLERWFGLVRELTKYGNVTMPDLPGFGGMASLYKIGEKPSLNTYAAYLAAFIKLRYKSRRLSIVAEGFGFLVATRMLARYPDIARKVDLVVSLAGFAHKDDLRLGKRLGLAHYRLLCIGLSFRPLAWTLGRAYVPLFVLRQYRSGHGQRHARRLEATALPAPGRHQSALWRQTDMRTHLATIAASLDVDNCQSRIDVPLWQVNLAQQSYFDPHFVEQHLRVAYKTCHFSQAKVKARRLFDSNARSVAILLPAGVRRALARS